jgi:hypothetical protein
MADVERRKVIIEYQVTAATNPRTESGIPGSFKVTPELVEQIRRELIRNGSRNPDIFGGRA